MSIVALGKKNNAIIEIKIIENNFIIKSKVSMGKQIRAMTPVIGAQKSSYEYILQYYIS